MSKSIHGNYEIPTLQFIFLSELTVFCSSIGSQVEDYSQVEYDWDE